MKLYHCAGNVELSPTALYLGNLKENKRCHHEEKLQVRLTDVYTYLGELMGYMRCQNEGKLQFRWTSLSSEILMGNMSCLHAGQVKV